MSKQEFDDFVSALFAAYKNIAAKRDMDAIDFRQFRMRMKIWEW